jgi:thiamine kinase-like enzyme
VHSSSQLRIGLDRARGSWIKNSLIHSDIRLDNWVRLASKPALGQNHDQVLLVDWEMVALGDRCWDIGCVFASYLSYWLFTDTANNGIEGVEMDFRLPIEIRDSLREFWVRYRQRFDDDRDEQIALERSLLFSGTRLIQTAFEHLRPIGALTLAASRMLEISGSLMRAPLKAGDTIYGCGGWD